MKPVVAIAMSGGIDSLVSAFILKKKGYPVFGLHFTTGFEPSGAAGETDPLISLSEQLGLPIHTVSLNSDFRASVVDYFVQSYRKGTTPNPCLVCNQVIKFGRLMRAAKELGADLLATGHYARVMRNSDGHFRLFKGVDHLKDQSYFLSFLSQKQLSTACFPLGNLTKDDVKAMAKTEGLVPLSKNESQDVCFIQKETYADFLVRYGGLRPDPGMIVTPNGETVGHHNGLHLFTVGQRRGINCPSTEPYYVVRLLPQTNTLVVGRKHDLASKSCRVDQINWISGSPPDFPFSAHVRLRYRHRAAPATLFQNEDGEFIVRFDTPQQAPTPGQGAAFYVKDEVVGAGIISS